MLHKETARLWNLNRWFLSHYTKLEAFRRDLSCSCILISINADFSTFCRKVLPPSSGWMNFFLKRWENKINMLEVWSESDKSLLLFPWKRFFTGKEDFLSNINYIYIYILRGFKTSGDAFRLLYSIAFDCSIRRLSDLFHSWLYTAHLSWFFGGNFVFSFLQVSIKHDFCWVHSLDMTTPNELFSGYFGVFKFVISHCLWHFRLHTFTPWVWNWTFK